MYLCLCLCLCYYFRSIPYPRKIEKLAQYLAAGSGGVREGGGGSAASMRSVAASGAGAGGMGRSLGAGIEVRDVCCGKDHTLLLTGRCPFCSGAV